MSVNFRHLVSCKTKKRYATWRLAHRAAGRMKENGKSVHAYRCEYGEHYHIGHSHRERKMEMEHVLTGTNCWCHPKVITVENGNQVIVHRSNQ